MKTVIERKEKISSHEMIEMMLKLKCMRGVNESVKQSLD